LVDSPSPPTFGRPIEVAGRFDGLAPDRAHRELTDETMAAIQELSGQVPVGVYDDRA